MDQFSQRIKSVRRWKIDKTYTAPLKEIRVQYEELSSEQKRIVNTVKEQLACPKELRFKQPLRAIIHGMAGTGKSAVLEYVYNMFRKELKKDEFIVAAYTGVCAHNIQAKTIHSCFKIKPFISYENQLKNLQEYDKLLFDLSNIQFIIFDEFSLIGLTLFGYLDILMRRSRPFYYDVPFGAASVILVGDPYQSLPVRDLPVFVPLSSLSLKGDFLKTAANTYRSFHKVFQLEAPFRQQGESPEQVQFRELLKEIRICKPSETTANLLASRKKSNLSKEERSLFKGSLRVFDTNKEVESYNSKKIHKRFRPEEILRLRNSDHPQVDTVLEIAIGSLVMLTKNKNVEAGLVNGSTGFITDVIFTSGSSLFYRNKRPPGDDIYAIIVNFGEYNGPVYIDGQGVSGVPILKVEDTLELEDSGKVVTLKRFPLRTCFALTKHKVIGLNLDRICIGFSDSLKFAGLDYVAISRVKRLQDIMIADDVNLQRLKARDDNALRGLLQQRVEEKRLTQLGELCK